MERAAVESVDGVSWAVAWALTRRRQRVRMSCQSVLARAKREGTFSARNDTKSDSRGCGGGAVACAAQM